MKPVRLRLTWDGVEIYEARLGDAQEARVGLKFRGWRDAWRVLRHGLHLQFIAREETDEDLAIDETERLLQERAR